MNKNLIISCIIAIILFVFIGYKGVSAYLDNKLENLSLCLKEKQVIFYGASWCENCALQKSLFKQYAGNLNYVECSPDPNGPQEEICSDNKIFKYPTWVGMGDNRLEGVMKLKTLSVKFGCNY